MKEPLKDKLLCQLEIWLAACKNDTETIYENCKGCPSREECRQAKRQIRKLIEGKPKVTKKFVEKPRINWEKSSDRAFGKNDVIPIKHLKAGGIRKLDLTELKPKVTKEFIKKWAELIDADPHSYTEISLKQMLKEAGVERKED